jgi:hypothetical protein
MNELFNFSCYGLGCCGITYLARDLEDSKDKVLRILNVQGKEVVLIICLL